MDRDRFDQLSRLVATAGTRRDVLRLVVAGAIAGAVGGFPAVAARKRKTARRGKQVRGVQAELCTNRCVDCSGKPIRPGADLARCDFDNEIFLDGLDLSSARLTNACFASTELQEARFNGADVGGACFADAILIGASFRGATVRKAVLCGADLRGVDFRGSNVTAAQLACATVGCDTILPNGKRAVTCGAGETCRDGECVTETPGPATCGNGGTLCPPCQTCQDGRCVAVADNTVACNGSPMESAGPDSGGIVCTPNTRTGICVGGACTCPGGVYDASTNTCQCAGNPCDPLCCVYFEACTDGEVSTVCRSCP